MRSGIDTYGFILVGVDLINEVNSPMKHTHQTAATFTHYLVNGVEMSRPKQTMKDIGLRSSLPLGENGAVFQWASDIKSDNFFSQFTECQGGNKCS